MIAIIPVASTSALEPEYSQLDCMWSFYFMFCYAYLTNVTAPKGLSLTFRGPPYPTSSDDPQSINFSLFCADDADPKAEPTFVSYENGVVRVDWSTPSACGLPDDQPPSQTPPQDPPQEDDDTPADDGGEESDTKPATRGSGLGFFFLV